MSGTVETAMSYNKSNKDLLEINKPIPFKKSTSFEQIYNEYLETCKDKSVEFSTSNFNPDDQNSPNVFVNKLENRIKLYYNSFK
tara:strand:+ start:412 stop:663 length:252 start_codon:yes stop_codon:yes gene_type:complete